MNDTRHRIAERKSARATALVIPILFGISIWDAFAAAPSAIVDLRVSPASTAPQLHTVLTWSAPTVVSGSGVSGPATSYDVRYSTTPIVDNAGFNAARSITGSRTRTGVLPRPAAPETKQEIEAVALTPNSTYYFAVKSTDATGTASPLSNVPSGTTAKYEGYGSATKGGGDGSVCRVTSLNSTGTGTLRNCLFSPSRSCKTAPLTVVFDVAGKITLSSDINVQSGDCRLTVDGSTAPFPGISIGMQPCPSGLTECPIGHPCLGGGEL